MRPEGERHGIAVDGRYGAGPLTIDGDRFALGRVFRNLITNAIQATAPAAASRSPPRAPATASEVTVTDTGSGIAPERLSAIFDDFVTTKRRGLGLGLAITKRIVEQLDGTITVGQRGRPGHRVHADIPRPRPAVGPGSRKLSSFLKGWIAMFRTLLKTTALAVADQTVDVRYFELRTPAGRPPLQRRKSCSDRTTT